MSITMIYETPAFSPLDNFSSIRKRQDASYEFPATPSMYDYSLESPLPSADYQYDGDRYNYSLYRVEDWTEDHTVAWLLDTLRSMNVSDYEFPHYSLRMPGRNLLSLSEEDIVNLLPMSYGIQRQIVTELYYRLHHQRSRDSFGQEHLLDLDIHKSNQRYSEFPMEEGLCVPPQCDSGDDGDYPMPSPDYPYSSDASKSGDEDDKRKVVKRSPGRPRGSGRSQQTKHKKCLPVPEFLKSLLMDSRYNPHIIRWEDLANLKFKFVKPDEVAKLWGSLKQNENMTFEKFSRAMRYHYRQEVLVSVPTARLVYQFGPKGPDFSNVKRDPDFKVELA